METVLDCVIPYIYNGSDRNSISLVSRKFYELDCITRKHLTVHVHYAPSPFRVSQRFPFIESLTLVASPFENSIPGAPRIDNTPWFREIAVSFMYLKALHIRRLVVDDSNIELLAKTRGNDLRSLKIYKCRGISDSGLMYVSMYCDKLATLCLRFELCGWDSPPGKWLHELALRNTAIETLSVKLYLDLSYYENIAPLLKKCSKSLVSLRLEELFLDDIRDAFSHAANLEHIGRFKLPPAIRSLGIYGFSKTKTTLPFELPQLCYQLRELELGFIDLSDPFDWYFLQRFPNLEVLCVKEVYGNNMGLQLVSLTFRKLRKLTFNSGTLVELIAVAQGCPNLEYLRVKLEDISNQALECIGYNLKYLRDFDMKLGEVNGYARRDLPLDNGTRAMLIGCTKLERLGIHLYTTAYLTDEGLGFIGKYGVNLRFLSLSHTGESDEGLFKLSNGCPKLRKLIMVDCPFTKQAVTDFVFNVHSLRYTWVCSRRLNIFPSEFHNQINFTLMRPDFKASAIAAQVLTETKPYFTLAEQLGKLAGQLLAGGSGLKSARVTYAIGRETDDIDTRLLRTMVAKGIRISEERVILDGSYEKPLDTIQVQIADMESRFGSAISESRDIQVEGIVKEGVPHLTKLDAYEMDVSLKGNIILCKQVDQPGTSERIKSILDKAYVSVYFTSVGRSSIGQQAVMAFVVDREPSKKALERIGEIPGVKEVMFLSF